MTSASTSMSSWLRGWSAGSRQTTARAMAYLARAPIGVCDGPEGRTILAGRPITFHGWALPGRRGDQVRILVRGQGVVWAETVPMLARNDVARIFGPRGLVSGWTMQATIDAAHLAAGVQLVATDGVAESVLARFRVHPDNATITVSPAPRFHGSVDSPQPGQRWHRRVLPVFGWLAIDGEAADVVDIYVDDEPPIRARRCDPRPDLIGMNGIGDSAALTAGYSALIVLPPTDEPRHVTVRVVGCSMAGLLWEPPPVTMILEPAVEPEQTALGPPGALPHVLDRGVEPGSGRPRVCVVTHSLLLGGGELYLQELLLRLVRAEVADFLVVAPQDGPLRAELEAAGITVHVTADFLVDAGRYEGRLAELAALMASWRSDVVLVNTLGVFPGVDAALRIDVPVVWAIHESFPLDVFSLNWGLDGLHPAVDRAWRRCLAEANQVIFESEATLDMFQREIPALSGRCVRYGIDPAMISQYEDANDRDALRAALGYEPADRVLLCMGVFLDRKSQLALIRAFADLAPAYPNARLVLVGDHPSQYGRAVTQFIEALGKADVIQVRPIDPDAYRWYRSADVLVSASDIESMPRSVLEAMTFGVPPLAADVFGLGEVITDGVNGWLCAARSGVALVAGLRRVLSCPADELAEMSLRARVDAKAFDGQGYADVYRDLIVRYTDQRRSVIRRKRNG